jgi:hypothetical protein
LSGFLTKEALFGNHGGIDSVDALYAKMNKIDTMFIPKGFPEVQQIDVNDRDAIYVGV